MLHRALVLSLLITLTAAAQPCTPAWSDQFGSDGPNRRVFAVGAFDPDGPGPLGSHIAIGGEFASIAGQPASQVAQWDGEHWSVMGDGLPGTVNCFGTFDLDGPGPNPPRLLAGGSFELSSLPSPTYFSVAVWDGQSWAPLGTGLMNFCYSLAVLDEDGPGPNPPTLFAGGYFSANPLRTVVRWSGASWVDVGDSFDDRVYALATADLDGPGPLPPALYAAGGFAASGATPIAHLARWTGSAWAQVAGADSIVFALAAIDPDGPGPAPDSLYLGGQFSNAGGIPAARIARYSSAGFEAMDAGLSGTVLSIFAADLDGPDPGTIIATGLLSNFTAPFSNSISRWTGTTWTAMGQGFNGGINAGTTWDDGTHGPRAVVVGDFVNASWSTPTPIINIPRVALWDNTNWTALGSSVNRGLNNTAYSLAVVDLDGPGPASGSLFVGGRFTTAGDIPVRGIARFDGRAWSALGSGIVGDVYALLAHDDDGPGPHNPALYAAGNFSSAGGVAAARIAKWDGLSWSALGSGLGSSFALGSAYDMVIFDDDGSGPNPPALIVAGGFTTAGGQGANLVARWDGSAWSPLGEGLTGQTVYALAVYDPDDAGPVPASLYAAGSFNRSGNTTINNLARWDGAAWQPVAAGVSGTVYALASFDADGAGPLLPRLYVGGNFNRVGVNTNALHIARFDGTSWSTLPGTVSGGVDALAVHDDDGDGPRLPALYAGGLSFSVPIAGFPPTFAQGVARFDGAAWSSLAPGLSPGPQAIASFDDDGPGPLPPALFAAGRMSASGTLSTENFARFGCPLPACYPNCDGSAAAPLLNVNDFVCFLNRFAAADPYANCDNSTSPPVLNILDFTCFLNQFAAGCP